MFFYIESVKVDPWTSWSTRIDNDRGRGHNLCLRFSKKYDLSLLSIEGWVLDWCWASTDLQVSMPISGIKAQSTYINREVQCLSPRLNWDPPTPSPPASVFSPPPGTKGGGDTLACGWGGGGSQFGRLERKPSTLSTLWCTRKKIILHKVLV
jgi:hypothetical protein